MKIKNEKEIKHFLKFWRKIEEDAFNTMYTRNEFWLSITRPKRNSS